MKQIKIKDPIWITQIISDAFLYDNLLFSGYKKDKKLAKNLLEEIKRKTKLIGH